jgi:hypothetical protein
MIVLMRPNSDPSVITYRPIYPAIQCDTGDRYGVFAESRRKYAVRRLRYVNGDLVEQHTVLTFGREQDAERTARAFAGVK